jgi:regulator of cell morphogenesis and NO signaling
MTLTEKTVREIAIESPATVPVFESLGIDYCCGGQRPLSEACARAGVTEQQALELITKALSEGEPSGKDKWSQAASADLIQYIVERHHGFVRKEVPRLETLFEKVIDHHGGDHPELQGIRELFSALSQELFGHMMKEEQILFPYLEKLEAASFGHAALPTGCFPSVEMPIARMLAEHDDAGTLLARIRSVADDFRPPESACPSYRRLYAGLEEFEQDLHRHIHLENNILFPRAAVMERSLRGNRP